MVYYKLMIFYKSTMLKTNFYYDNLFSVFLKAYNFYSIDLPSSTYLYIVFSFSLPI